MVPSAVKLLTKFGWKVRVERDAGAEAKFRDRDYELAGAEIVSRENAFTSGKADESYISDLLARSDPLGSR